MKKSVTEQFFQTLLNATDGDYTVQAQLAAAIHPEGW